MAKGMFIDTSICTGCKACQVACKEWNALPHERPSPRTRSFPVRFRGEAPGRRQLHRQLLRQHRRLERHRLAARPLHRAVQRGPLPRAMVFFERFVQALQRRRLPERLPHRRHRSYRPG
ncbi:MAG TPA: hypothetical protein VK303_04035 [Desulfobacteria bacterium]|nr:hypothetical protein [Desulfobacteria bacterium]